MVLVSTLKAFSYLKLVNNCTASDEITKCSYWHSFKTKHSNLPICVSISLVESLGQICSWCSFQLIYICWCSFLHTIEVVQTSLNTSGMSLFIIINFFPLLLSVSLWTQIGPLCIIAPNKWLHYSLVPENLKRIYQEQHLIFWGSSLSAGNNISVSHWIGFFFSLPLQFSFFLCSSTVENFPT